MCVIVDFFFFLALYTFLPMRKIWFNHVFWQSRPSARTNQCNWERTTARCDERSFKITPFETKMTTFSLCMSPPLCNCIYLFCFFTRMRWLVINVYSFWCHVDIFSRKPKKYQFIYTFSMLLGVFHLDQTVVSFQARIREPRRMQLYYQY